MWDGGCSVAARVVEPINCTRDMPRLAMHSTDLKVTTCRLLAGMHAQADPCTHMIICALFVCVYIFVCVHMQIECLPVTLCRGILPRMHAIVYVQVYCQYKLV